MTGRCLQVDDLMLTYDIVVGISACGQLNVFVSLVIDCHGVY
jgi:hypothetical protein